MDEVQAEEPEGIIAWLTDPSAAPHGGESIENLIDRVGLWMDEQCAAKHHRRDASGRDPCRNCSCYAVAAHDILAL
jgi:broad specificity phosphatase PhoE